MAISERHEWRFFANLPWRPALRSSAPHRPLHRLSAWNYDQSMRVMPTRSSAPSRRSRGGKRRPACDRELGDDITSQSDYWACGSVSITCCLLYSLFRHCGRPSLLWTRFCRPVPARSRLCRSYPQRGEAGRYAGADADKIQSVHQPENGEGSWSNCATIAARPRRRGDRITTKLLHCMSPLLALSGHPAVVRQCLLLGVKQTSRLIDAMSAFDPKQT
jgi:hypothetical protein